MRVFSLVSLAAVMSVAVANPCKPSPVASSSVASVVSSAVSSSASSSASSVVSSSASSSVSSSVSSSPAAPSSSAPSSSAPSSSSSSVASSSSAAPVPIATFNIEAMGSSNTAVNGLLLATENDPNAANNVQFSPQTLSPMSIQPLHLESGTNYLMVGSYYVAYYSADSTIYSVSSVMVGEYPMQQLVCSRLVAGVPLTCHPVNLPTYNTFYVVDYAADIFKVSMYNPGFLPPGFNAVNLVAA